MKSGVRVSINCAIFCLLGLIIPSVFASPKGVENTEGTYLVETTILSPSGPILKKDWIDIKSNQPIRIEYSKITSGRPIVGSLRIILKQNGCWVVESLDGNVVPLICPGDRVGKKIVFVMAGAQRWEVTVISIYKAPLERQGVAAESESSIDLLINRSE